MTKREQAEMLRERLIGRYVEAVRSAGYFGANATEEELQVVERIASHWSNEMLQQETDKANAFRERKLAKIEEWTSR